MRLTVSLVVSASVVLGCSSGDKTGSARKAVTAFCDAEVIGTGIVDVETDYIPNVVNCENGAASLEALKAQAVAARSYLYYRLERTGDIADGTSDQVYSCSRAAGPLHMQAAEETAGLVLRYKDTQVAAFYVAGAKQTSATCTGGTDDATNTERFVTYNEGKSGDTITQTTLGWVEPTNYANRGCKSQNGADCLSDMGWRYDRILRFYYGEDIEIVRAEGACITVDEPDAGTDAGGGAGSDDATGGCDSSRGANGSAAFGVLVIALALTLRRRRRPFCRAAARRAGRVFRS